METDNGYDTQAAARAEALSETDLASPARHGGGYENAPATRMLATHCACCRRPLVDSVSVDTGVGPECRRKYGFDRDVPEAARREANQLVYQIALEDGGLKVAQACERLRQLGFDKLAAVVEKRACPVRIEQAGNLLFVWAPYNELATRLFQGVRGRRWHGKDCTCSEYCSNKDGKEKKFNSFPLEQKGPLFQALVRAYLGLIAKGPKGAFKIGAVS